MRRLPELSEITVETLKGVAKGAAKGGAVGVAASIATGAAVIVSAPVWLPWVGGTLVVSGATVAAWSATGAAIGAASGGGWSYWKRRKLDKEFEKEFGQK